MQQYEKTIAVLEDEIKLLKSLLGRLRQAIRLANNYGNMLI